MTNTVPLSKYINEVKERIGSDSRIVYSVTNDRGFVPSLEQFDKQVFSKDIANYKLVADGDLAYNPSRINVGSVAICNDPNGGAVSPMYVIVRCQHSLLPRYLLYFLKSSFGLTHIRHRCEGAVRFQLKFKDLQRIPIYVPSINEQSRILHILDEADELLRLRAEADRRTADLIPAIFHDMFGDVVNNGRRWKTIRFSEIGDTRLGKMLDAKQQTGNHSRLYLRNANVQWDRFALDDILQMDFDKKDRQVFRLQHGDVLVCEGGEAGRAAIWRDELPECYFQKALHRVRPHGDKAIPEYIVYLLWFYAHGGGFKDHVTSATIAHLTGEKLKAMMVPLPPLSLQREFAARVTEVRAMEAKQAAARRRLDDLFQSLLHRAFPMRPRPE